LLKKKKADVQAPAFFFFSAVGMLQNRDHFDKNMPAYLLG
jgi:hypothetical protein